MAKKINHRGHGELLFLCVLCALCGFPNPFRKIIKSLEIISALSCDGFYLRSQKGSHQRYHHPSETPKPPVGREAIT
jgi:hypothetical protein